MKTDTPMNDTKPTLDALLNKYRAEDGHENPAGYRYSMEQLFQGIQLRDRSVLEIGSGRGLISLHCAVQGASRVLSMEPEMEGSTGGVTAIQQQRTEELGLDTVELLRQDFHDADLEGQSFDAVIMIAVLNHLYETPIDASKDSAVFDQFVKIAKKLYGLLNEGGVVIATDACRYSLWTQAHRFGLPRKLCLTQKTIEWRIHQQPSVWKNIFRSAGFQSCEIHYPVPYRLRKFHSLADTAFVNWALHGGFILHAMK